MADHLHKQLRAALKTALTGLATTGARVYANRLHPLADANLPGLRLYLDSERAERLTVHAPYVQQREPEVVVECCAKEPDGLDDTLDQISKEVEVALAAGVTVAGRTLELIYSGMEFDDEISNKPVGVKRLRFATRFMAQSNAPDTLV